MGERRNFDRNFDHRRILEGGRMRSGGRGINTRYGVTRGRLDPRRDNLGRIDQEVVLLEARMDTMTRCPDEPTRLFVAEIARTLGSTVVLHHLDCLGRFCRWGRSA